MRLSLLLSAILGATALALPTTAGDPKNHPDPSTMPPNVGGVIYRAQHREGIYEASHYQLLYGSPAGAQPRCTNLQELYGFFQDVTRSLEVYKGFRCTFSTELDCKGVEQGKTQTLGCKDKMEVRDTLEVRFDRKIKSYVCARLE